MVCPKPTPLICGDMPGFLARCLASCKCKCICMYLPMRDAQTGAGQPNLPRPENTTNNMLFNESFSVAIIYVKTTRLCSRKASGEGMVFGCVWR